ncbi:MAG: 50S ribosomal protein L10 [Nanopusillaceae archaeon]
MVAEWKINYVKDLKDKIKKVKVLSLANVMDIPSLALQTIRKNLKVKDFEIKTVKKSLLIKALEELSKENQKYKEIINILEKNKRSTIMLLIPKEDINPFILNKILEENKSYREARVGDVLEDDIVVKAGPTNFAAGPAISMFKKYNIKTKVEGGKIVIVEDSLIAKKGDVVSKDLADLLQKLGIRPIPVKVKLMLAYDGKTLYTDDVLSIPLDKYVEELKSAFKKAISLSVYAGIPDRNNIKLLVKKAHENSYKLSIKAGIPTKYNIKELFKSAISIGKKLKDKVNL